MIHQRLILCIAIVALCKTSTQCWSQLPIVIAHRGASGYLPEHTLVAKSLAYGMSADYIEQDVVLSKDSVPVVLHDIHLDAVTDVAKQFPDRKRQDGRFYAIDFTLAEIKQLNVNERIQIKTGQPAYASRFPAGSTSLRINSLEEELNLVQGLNQSTGKKIGIYPEIKKAAWHLEQGQDISAIVVEILQQHGYKTKSDLCWLQCFEWPEVQRIRQKLGWEGRLVQLMGSTSGKAGESEYDKLQTSEGMAQLAKVVDAVGPDLRTIFTGNTLAELKPSEFVERAHQHKLAVHAYTVRADELPKPFESLDQLHRLLLVDAKVDGLFTDFPDKTAQFVQDNRIWLTQLNGLEPIKLWPSTPPGKIAAKGEERDTSDEKSRTVEGKWVVRLGDVSTPTLTMYLAPKEINTGTVVVVCPGGGYNILAWNLEGTEVCQWLNSIGVNAALLKYRVPRVDKETPVEPLQDAQRAISLVRARAAEWAINPERIGILGFSAGGHLSARASTQYEKRSYENIDAIDQTSCRPDFTLLIYPAYLFDKNKDDLLSSDLPIDAKTPPMFLTMALDDPIDSENVLRMSTALKRAKVSNELHLFPSGGHGYGLRPNEYEATGWPNHATQWLRTRGLLTR